MHARGGAPCEDIPRICSRLVQNQYMPAMRDPSEYLFPAVVGAIAAADLAPEDEALVKADAEADEPTHEEPAEMASRYKKHGKVQVLASARRTPPMSPQQARRVDQAWTRLNADLDKTRKGRR